MCQDEHMPDYDPETEADAYAEMDALTAEYDRIEKDLAKIRKKIQEAIVRRLKAKDAPIGKLAEHTPYDRNHVGRIAREGGVPAERKPTVRSIKSQRRGKQEG